METFPSSVEKLGTADGVDMDEIYVLQEPCHPWGDYGSILFNGLFSRPVRVNGDDGILRLERTGPFVPPISFPGSGAVVVTDSMKSALLAADFQGISFQPVEKVKIVDLPWHEWDFSAPEPPQYPLEGEPEGYVLENEHSRAVSKKVGNLWEVVLIDSATVVRIEGSKRKTTFAYVPGTWNGNDLFSVDENYYVYCSPRAKAWFERYFAPWTAFSGFAETKVGVSNDGSKRQRGKRRGKI